MTSVKVIRSIGVIAGVILFGYGIYWAIIGIFDPPSQSDGTYSIMVLTEVLTGILFFMPWSRIRSVVLWYIFIILFVISVLLCALIIYTLNTWAVIHGAGGAGYVLIALLLTVGALQLPAFWVLKPKWRYGN